MSHTSRLDKLQALRPGWTWVHQIDSNETYHIYHYTSDASYAYHFTSAIGCLHHCQSGWEVMAHASEISDPFDEVETREVELSPIFFLRLGRHPRSWKETHAFWGRFFPVGGVKSDGKRRKTQRMEIFRKTTFTNFVGFLDFRSGAQGTRRASARLEGQRTRWTSTGLEGLMLSLGHWWWIVLLESKTEWSRK